MRKPALKPELTPAGFPEQLQKLLIGSYEHRLMILNPFMIHWWGTRALSKKVSFIAAYTFFLFSPSFASTVSPLSCSDPVFHHVFTYYSALFFPLPPPPPQVSSGFLCHLPPQEPPFVLTAAVWSGLLALLPAVMNTDLGLRGTSLQYLVGGGPVWL